MTYTKYIFLFLSATISGLYGQKTLYYADSIHKTFHIPEINYAVVSEKAIVEMAAIGHHSIDLKDTASLNDRFHIGSNTKAMTAFMIAKYVEKGKLSWKTPFFDLFPAWKKAANAAYYDITLQDLLSHRAKIQAFQDEGDSLPKFVGTKVEKRQAFGKYALTLPPVEIDSIAKYHYSNAGYTLATLMLEKVSGKSWEELVYKTFNEDLKINVQLSWPENQKKKDTWGHYTENGKLVAVPSNTDYLLDYTEPAGDMNISLPEYAKFIQLNLKGLHNKNNYLSAKTYQFIHKGIENYSIAWFNSYENGKDFSTHSGTAGTYYTLVAIDRKKHLGYIIFCNAFNEETVNGIRLLMRKLKANYGS